MGKATRTEAEAKFARAQSKATDAARALSDAAAEAKRVEQNTARLRALRLARDAKVAADLAAEVQVVAKNSRAKSKPVGARAAARAAK